MIPALVLLLAVDLGDIKPRMQEFVDQHSVSGVVTLVQKDGKRLHLEATGWQDSEKKIPMKTDTIFEIMSMTKPVTGVAIAMLVEEGKLSFADPVVKHLPEFAERKETIRDLLTHTSGMPEYGPAATKDLYGKFNWTLEQAALLFSQQPSLTEPQKAWQYSNPGIATLGRIVEVVSGTSYEKFCEERIFRPLGMNDSHFYIPESKRSRVAMVYMWSKDGKSQPAGDAIYRAGSKYPMPEGGLYSTAEDYAKFLEAMRKGGAPLLSGSTVNMMIQNHTGNIPKAPSWGLSWAVDSSKEGFGHGGAFGTHGWAERKTGTVRVLMVQKFGASAEDIRNAFTNIVNASFN